MLESEIHPHVPAEKADLFNAPDREGSTESEYTGLIYSLVRAVKPHRVLETGTGNAITTAAIARALNMNANKGSLLTVELDADKVDRAKSALRGLPVEVWHGKSLDAIRLAPSIFDFAFLDSDLSVRATELEALVDHKKLSKNAIVAIHDTSRLRSMDGTPDPGTKHFWEHIERLSVLDEIRYIEFPLSRGLTLLQLAT